MLEEALRGTVPAPVYQRLGRAAAALRATGCSDHSAAVEFGVSDKTIAKAIRWFASQVRAELAREPDGRRGVAE